LALPKLCKLIAVLAPTRRVIRCSPVPKTLQIDCHFLRQRQITRIETLDLSHFRENAVSQITESRQLLLTRSRNCANHVVGFLAQFRAQVQLPELLAAQRFVRPEENGLSNAFAKVWSAEPVS
jgi:hypothetical protein